MISLTRASGGALSKSSILRTPTSIAVVSKHPCVSHSRTVSLPAIVSTREPEFGETRRGRELETCSKAVSDARWLMTSDSSAITDEAPKKK